MKKLAEENFYYGTGRRKCSVARVRLYPGAGSVTVNDKPLEEALPRIAHTAHALKPFQVTETEGRFDARVKVEGGGLSGWAGAIAHGLARALVAFDENLRKPLRQAGLLTRDPRVKERKKYGLKRARKAPQYSKR